MHVAKLQSGKIGVCLNCCNHQLAALTCCDSRQRHQTVKLSDANIELMVCTVCSPVHISDQQQGCQFYTKAKISCWKSHKQYPLSLELVCYVIETFVIAGHTWYVCPQAS